MIYAIPYKLVHVQSLRSLRATAQTKTCNRLEKSDVQSLRRYDWRGF